MNSKMNKLNIIEKIIGAISICISCYYILIGLTAWDSLFIISHIQGVLNKVSFVVETIINFYLIPFIVFTLGLLYVTTKINLLAFWLLIINYIFLLFMIIVQNMNIKSYLLLVIVNSLLLAVYIVHKHFESKNKQSSKK